MDTGRSIVAIDQAGAGQELAEIVKSDAPVDVLQGALDDVFEIDGGQDARLPQREQMPPGLGRKAPVLVGSKNAEGLLRLHRRSGRVGD